MDSEKASFNLATACSALGISPESEEPLKDWLTSLNQSEYYQKFTSNDIDVLSLLELSYTDLKFIVDKIGDRIRINKAIQAALSMIDRISPATIHSFQTLHNMTTSDDAELTATATIRKDTDDSTPTLEPKPSSIDDGPVINVAFHLPSMNMMTVQFPASDSPEDMWDKIVLATNLPNEFSHRFNDGFDFYDDIDELHGAIFNLNVTEFWVETLQQSDNRSSNVYGGGSGSGAISGGAADVGSNGLSSPSSQEPSHLRGYSKAGSGGGSNEVSLAGNRPTSEQVALRIEEYFPNADIKRLHQGIRNSVVLNNRLSTIHDQRASTVLSKRVSYYPSIEAGSSHEYYNKVLGSRHTLTEETISEIEEDDDQDLLDRIKDEKCFPSEWLRGRLIGAGSFGSVYLGFNVFSGDIFAVKQIEINDSTSNRAQIINSCRRELYTLRDLDHDNIVQYLGFQSDDQYLNIFLEYIPGGSLAHRVEEQGPLSELEVKHFIKQCLQGLKYLHEKGIIHRDIKGANILVDTNNVAKISDFGFSRQEQTYDRRMSIKGTVYWMAPEVAKPKSDVSITTKVDIWSLGCMIVELITGSHPFPDLEDIQALYRIGNGVFPSVPDYVSQELRDFLSLCFVLDPKQRASTVELLEHPFIVN